MNLSKYLIKKKSSNNKTIETFRIKVVFRGCLNMVDSIMDI